MTQDGIDTAISRTGNSYSSFCMISSICSAVASTQLSGTTVRPYISSIEAARVRLLSLAGSTQLSRIRYGLPICSSSAMIRRSACR